MKKTQSTCNYCSIDCNLDFYVEDNRIVKVVPTPGYPVNNGFCCIKGLSLDKQQTVSKPEPLPKVRQSDGTFRTMSWEETYELAAKKLLDLKERYGPESIAGISTGQLTMEEFAIFGHVMRNFLHAHLDGNTRLCMATSVVAYKQSFGFDAPGFTMKDAELSDTLIFIGANPVVAHPVLWGRVRENKNKKVIVIDPRKSETAKNADYYYGIKPKTDLTLLYTVANLLIEDDKIDHAFIEQSTNGFEEFKEFVSSYHIDDCVNMTGLKKEQILELVKLIETGKKVSFWWTMGVNQSYEAVRTAQAIINLALMTGQIGKPGTGPNSITGQCNAMGSRLYSNTTCFFGGGEYSDPARREQIAKVLHMEEDMLPTKPTIPYNEIVERINRGEIKALWILCTNPRHSWTNNETFQKAIDKLELYIVQDVYDDTESAVSADIFFPVVPGIKKKGTYINMERRLSGMRGCLPKEEDEKSDYEVIYDMGQALGMGHYLDGWETPESAFELVKKCTKGMPSDITGVTWEMLTGKHGVQWPFKEGDELKEDQRRLYGNGKFFTPSKKANFIFEEVRINPLPTSETFPFVFNTGRGSVGQWHTQTRTREVQFVADVCAKKAYVFMNDKLAKEHDIKDGDKIRIFSANGHSADFFVKVTCDVQYKEFFAPIHYVECNKLTVSIYDPYSKEPSYKSAPVNFKKVGV